jgi:hypothetical protein
MFGRRHRNGLFDSLAAMVLLQQVDGSGVGCISLKSIDWGRKRSRDICVKRKNSQGYVLWVALVFLPTCIFHVQPKEPSNSHITLVDLPNRKSSKLGTVPGP